VSQKVFKIKAAILITFRLYLHLVQMFCKMSYITAKWWLSWA